MDKVNIESIVLYVENDSRNLIISLNAAVNQNPDLNNNYKLLTKRINTLQDEFYRFDNAVKKLKEIKKEISGVYQNYTERTKVIE